MKLTCPPAQMAGLLSATGVAEATGAVARAGNGVAYVQLAGADIAAIQKAARAAHDLGGNAVLEEAPDEVKRAVDAWDPAGIAATRRNDYDLMRAIKAQFDPKNTLNPGRFVAGI
jgi:glycolate oxidase FAD binding subunit